jgi:hypothetical protein
VEFFSEFLFVPSVTRTETVLFESSISVFNSIVDIGIDVVNGRGGDG